MADDVIDFEGLKLGFLDLADTAAITLSSGKRRNTFYIGQLINLQLSLPLTKVGQNKLKTPHPPRSPVSQNLVQSFMRQLSSLIDVKCSINHIDAQQEDNGCHSNRCADDWSSCNVISSHHESHKGTSDPKTEAFLSKDQCVYHMPLQVRVPSLPKHCDTAQLWVQVRLNVRQAPRWLSSPSKPESQAMEKMEDSSVAVVKGNTVKHTLRILHPPALCFQQKTVEGKHMIFLQVKNTTLRSLVIEECEILPESCPKSSTGAQTCSSNRSNRGYSKNICVIHANMVKLLCGHSNMFPVTLRVGESYSLCYNLNTASERHATSRDDLSLVTHIKWTIPSHGMGDTADVLTTYRLPLLNLKPAHFVMNASVEESQIKKGECFTISYSITNRLQDFVAIKLHWNPILIDESVESGRNLERIRTGLVCQDPCTQLGSCPYGSTVQAKVRFQALTTGIFEVCKHMKINLRYLIPATDTPSLSSPTSQTSRISDDHLLVASEELWRSRSGSGSSFNDPRVANAEERRLSFANKSYSFGDLGPSKSAESDNGNRKYGAVSSAQRDQRQSMSSASRYEQLLLSPGNFTKNSCKIYIR